jgi:hypothetical protein
MPDFSAPGMFGAYPKVGPHRQRFWRECVEDLRHTLEKEMQSGLLISSGHEAHAVRLQTSSRVNCTAVRHIGWLNAAYSGCLSAGEPQEAGPLRHDRSRTDHQVVADLVTGGLPPVEDLIVVSQERYPMIDQWHGSKYQAARLRWSHEAHKLGCSNRRSVRSISSSHGLQVRV